MRDSYESSKPVTHPKTKGKVIYNPTQLERFANNIIHRITGFFGLLPSSGILENTARLALSKGPN
jgi:hypothetical protein